MLPAVISDFKRVCRDKYTTPSSTDQECCKLGVITLSQYTALKWGLGEGRNLINEVLVMGKEMAFKPHDTP